MDGLKITTQGNLEIVFFSENDCTEIFQKCVEGHFERYEINPWLIMWKNDDAVVINPGASNIINFFVGQCFLKGTVLFTGGDGHGLIMGLTMPQIDFLISIANGKFI